MEKEVTSLLLVVDHSQQPNIMMCTHLPATKDSVQGFIVKSTESDLIPWMPVPVCCSFDDQLRLGSRWKCFTEETFIDQQGTSNFKHRQLQCSSFEDL
jgi:hypothetical protein